MKAFITGNDGLAGRVLSRSLSDDGWDIDGIDIRAGGDVRDYETVRAAFDWEPDAVFHLAAVAQPGEALSDPRRTMDINVTGALNVLEAARHTRSGARIVLAGSSEEYGYEGRPECEVLTEDSVCHPSSAYGASKLAATSLGMAYARRYGLHVIAMRPWNHTGPGRPAAYAESAFARRVVAVERGEADCVTHGDLSASRDFTDVRDMVRAYRLAAEKCGPGIYNACSGRVVTMRDVLNILAAQSQAPAVIFKEDPSLGHRVQGPFPLPSCLKLRDATGWQAEIPLEETLGGLLNYWRAQ